MTESKKVYISYPTLTGSNFWFYLKRLEDRANFQTPIYIKSMNDLEKENQEKISKTLKRVYQKYPLHIENQDLGTILSNELYPGIYYNKEIKVDKIILIGEWFYSLECWKAIASSREANIKIVEFLEESEIYLTYKGIKGYINIFENFIESLWGKKTKKTNRLYLELGWKEAKKQIINYKEKIK